MPGVTYTERTVNATGYNPGPAAPGGPVRILFGAIVFSQPRFISSFDVYAERTVASGVYTEKTVTLSTYVERTF